MHERPAPSEDLEWSVHGAGGPAGGFGDVASAEWVQGADGEVAQGGHDTGAAERTLEDHTGRVSGVCAVRVGGRELLASADADRTVRLWDPATAHSLHQIPIHYEALGLANFARACLVVGLSAGLLALSLTTTDLRC
jgi:WD40 repeat protein